MKGELNSFQIREKLFPNLCNFCQYFIHGSFDVFTSLEQSSHILINFLELKFIKEGSETGYLLSLIVIFFAYSADESIFALTVEAY